MGHQGIIGRTIRRREFLDGMAGQGTKIGIGLKRNDIPPGILQQGVDTEFSSTGFLLHSEHYLGRTGVAAFLRNRSRSDRLKSR
jgi:hypothetical protein